MLSLAATVLVVGASAATARAATPDPLGPLEQLVGHLYVSTHIPPPGANNWDCKPTAAHPFPVVLVHGTLFDETITWNLMAPAIEHAGYCVFALDYGNRGTGPIVRSAHELAAFINRVLAATGAQRVDIVGHSQGGMMPRYYLKFLGGTAHVHDLIGLAPSNHGTTLPLAAPLGQYGDCPACTQQVAGSPFLTHLNAGDQTPGPVNYTVIESNHDEIVTPYTSAFLPPEDGRVTNILLQDDCPADVSEHVLITDDPVAVQWVLNALASDGPADPSFKPDCTGLKLLSEL
jgi:triacylglycerol esterase/lipase EstA (alpha/beta hydrolase family)